MARKLELHPGQITIEVPSKPLAMQFDPVRVLDQANGIVRLDELPYFEYDPEEPLTFIEFAGKIGVALAENPRSGMTDRELDVHGKDLQRASRKSLSAGLYFDKHESYDRSDVVILSYLKPTKLKAPGVIPDDRGVAVSSEEFPKLAHSPRQLARNVESKTKNRRRNPRPDEKRLDDEEIFRKGKSSRAKTMLSRRKVLLDHDKGLKVQRSVLLAINGLIQLDDAPCLPIPEMDAGRQVSEHLFHEMVQIACDQLEWGTTVHKGIDRALASNLYRGTPEEIAANWRGYTRWAGYYIDAKRGKIDQSLQACGQVFNSNKRYMKKEDLAEAETPATA